MSGVDFAPIGYANLLTTRSFKGTFDGDSYTISGLKFDKSNDNDVGLFAYLGEGGTIKNVTLTNVNVSGKKEVGALVGKNCGGIIENCTVSGTVKGTESVGGIVGYNYSGTVRGSTFSGTVNGTDYVGALVGYNYDTVTYCTINGNNGTISGKQYVGGVGYNDKGTVQNCSASNVEFSGTDYVGVVGGNYKGTVIDNCAVNVSGSGEFAGSIVGYNYESGIISDNFYRSGFAYDIGGYDNEANIIDAVFLRVLTLPGGVTASGAKLVLDNNAYAPWGTSLTLSAKTGYIYSGKEKELLMEDETLDGTATLNTDNHYVFKSGDTYTLATADNVVENNYPDLVQVYELTMPEGVSIASGIFAVDGTTTYAVGKITLAAKTGYKISGDMNLTVSGAATVTVTSTSYWGVTDGADGSAEKPFLISTVDDLQFLAEYVNGGKDCAGLNFKLNADFNLNDVSLTSIGNESNSFKGTFDGDGHKISNLTISGSNYVGLFGNVGTGGTVQNVTLINATVNGNSNVGALVGCNGGTVSGNKIHGNKDAVGKNSGTADNTRYFKLTLPDGVTVTDANTITDGETIYYASGSTFKLTVDMSNYPQYHKIRSVNNTFADSDGTFTVTMGNGDTNVTISGYPKIAGLAFDSSTDTYTIATRDDLQTLADYVNGGGDTSNLTFKLAADIGGVDFNIGTESNRFKGTLDGDGHTITVNYTAAENYCALFNYVDGATIQKLTVDGMINTAKQYAAGIVACVYGTTTISDCRSSVTIDSSVSGDGTHGGLVGLVESGGTLNITDSIFDGKLLGSSTTNCGGFIGWRKDASTLNITNCLFAPQEVTISATGTATFARNGVNDLNGGYYMQTLVDTQGTQVYAEPAMPDGVTAKFQSGYNVTFNGTTYYKSGATVTLTVTAYPDGKYLTGATLNDDATYTCTIDDVASVAWTALPTIDGLTFDTSIGAYKISNAAELQALATYVNAGNDCTSLNFRLTANINLSGVSWKPIGDSSKKFKGTFNGDGYTVSNLTISGNNSYLGLFGNLGGGGTVKNVALTKVNIGGDTFVGGLVGYNSGGTVQNCSISGTIGGRYLVGGLVAANDFGTIDNCKVSGTVSCTDHHGGGLVGSNNNGSVTNCTAGVTVNGTQFVGVLVGHNRDGGKVNDNKYYSAPNSSIAVVNNDDATAADNTRVYKITLPNGIAIAGNNLVLVDGNTAYGTSGVVTLSVKTGCVLNSGGEMSYSIPNEDLDLSSFFSVTDYWGVADGADGSADNPFLISDVAGLQYLATYVSGGGDTSGLNFKLATDLDLSGVDNWATLIGTDEVHQFNGIFDGDGHKISKFAINLADNNYIGLFGYIGGNATIQNVAVENISVRGQNNVGGLVGYSEGGTVKNITLNNAFVSGKTWSGGIVGYNEGGTITDCTVTGGQIVGTGSYGGGVVSFNKGGTVGNCTFSGTVTSGGNYVGGIVGYNNNAEVTNCAANGTISGTDETSSAVGGLVGYNQGGTVKDGPFSNVEVSGNKEVGGLVGYNSGSGTVSGNKFYGNAVAVGEDWSTSSDNTRYYKLTLPEGVSAMCDDTINVNGTDYYAGSVTLSGLKAGYAFNTGTTFNITQNTTVSFNGVWGVTDGADGSANKPYEIGTVEDLRYLADYVNDGNNCAGQTFKLTADINLSGVDFAPIGTSSNPFGGIFDGGNFKISNLTIDGGNYVGLFGVVESGTIQNVKLENVNLSGDTSVGGIVGYNTFAAETGTITYGKITDCTVSGTINGNSNVGGLVGFNSGEVTNCTAIITVSGENNVGALVGYNSGKISGNKFYGNADAFAYSDGTVENNTRYYKLTLPEGVTVSGNKYTVNGTDYYAGSVTLSGLKEGYVFSTGDSFTIEQDTTVTATLADGHYVFKDGDTYTLATNSNVGDYPELTPVYELTLPEGVTASGDICVTVDGKTYAAGEVTLTVGNGAALANVTGVNNIAADNDGKISFALGDDINIADTNIYYAVTIPNCVQNVNGTSETIDNTTYYRNGSTLNLTAKTGYVVNSVKVSADTSITATLADGHYVFKDGDTYTLATNSNVGDYPELTPVYELTMPEGVTASGDICVTVDGKTYATGEVTLTATNSVLQKVQVNGSDIDGNKFIVNSDANITAEFVSTLIFNGAGTGATVGGTTGDLSSFSSVYSITASQQNSTLVGNGKNNTVILEGGGENILTGGGGNDTFKFESGGGIVTDYGIGATKSGDGKTLSAAPGSDVVKVSGNVTGIYFDRNASSKKSAKFTAVVTYGSGDDTQIIVLQNINKKPTKTGSKPTYQTNDVAAATLKIWDTSGSKQAVLSASKLKKLFHDDSELSADLLSQVASLGKLDGIGDLNLPAVDALNQTAQATFNGGDNG